MTETSKAVFLSYASQDTEAAHRLARALRAAGVEVWLDTSELRGGDSWDQQIRRQIHDCALFVPIISLNTASRLEGYFRLEWKLAVDRSHLMAAEKPFLLPVVVDATQEDNAHVPDKFREVQWTRLPAGATPAAFVERIQRLLGSAGVHVEPTHPSGTPLAAYVPLTPLPMASTARSKRSPLSIGLIAALAATIAFIGWQHFKISTPTAPAATLITTVPNATPSTVATRTEQSIAVLPFLNESSDKEQEYFADGLTETMIDLLSKVPDLHVAARTSSFYFKGKNERLPTIAKELKVANVLEGSVRKSGNRLRITTRVLQVRARICP